MLQILHVQHSVLAGHALLIGVGGDLPMTVSDATALRDVLVDPSRAGYPGEQVELLGEETATRQKILEACDRLIDRTSNNPDATVGAQHPFVNLIKDLDENFPFCYYAGGDVEKKFLDSESGSTSSDSTTEKDAPWKERIKQIKIEQL